MHCQLPSSDTFCIIFLYVFSYRPLQQRIEGALQYLFIFFQQNTSFKILIFPNIHIYDAEKSNYRNKHSFGFLLEISLSYIRLRNRVLHLSITLWLVFLCRWLESLFSIEFIFPLNITLLVNAFLSSWKKICSPLLSTVMFIISWKGTKCFE